MNDFRSVELLSCTGRQNFVSVLRLHLSFTLVVALPMELMTSDFDKLVKVKTFGEDAEHVDKHFEVVKIRVN